MVDRVEWLAEFAWAASQSPDVRSTIVQIVTYSQRLIGADHAGVTLIRSRGRLATVGATDDLINKVDELQVELREGPCVKAALDAPENISADLAVEPRWPHWGPRVAALGLRSILSVPLRTRDRRLGALNVYGVDTDRFGDQDAETGHLFAAHAAAALSAAMAQADLRHAVETRTEIGQAQGILMERYKIDSDRAITILKRFSQDTNTKLRDVARKLIAKGELPGGG